ncbi:MAG: hypothetical protein NC221_03525 [Duncaniella sp.]|nr:hypothetical protein [Muribaculum sp.]MCM1255172.1 hypothetical protein [Duncaniella sp.]
MTSSQTKPRVEIVGSFLPPEELEEARKELKLGTKNADEVKAIEDQVIDRLIDREIKSGLKIVTDGEIRRKKWDCDFWEGLNGISRDRIDTGRIYQDDPVRHDILKFNGRIEFNPEHPFFAKFSHMQEITAGRAEVRQTIPSPGELYMRILLSGNGDIAKIYSSPDSLEDDIVEAYRMTIEEFHKLGCRHIQLDTSVWGRLTDPYFEKTLFLSGNDPYKVTEKLVSLLNRTVNGRPADIEITLNIAADETNIPRWGDEKELEHIRKMLEEVNADAFLLPFDVSNLAHLDVLKWLPAGKRAIIGLVDGSLPNMESINDLVNAIHVATRYVPMESLSISPTCGFKVRDRERQGLNYESQWTKIDLLNEAADLFLGR